MAFISQASIQEVKDRVDVIAVVSDYVRLEKRGSRYWACCPFHQEKSPSFTVNPDLKMFHCFGCQKSGSVINFVMEMDKLSFPEAIELLARRSGVELVYDNAGGGGYPAADEARKKEKEDLYGLYRRISGTFFHFLLENHDFDAVKRYIISRGISVEMIERFRLGYSPADRGWLHKFLTKKGYSREFLAASGLFSSQYPERAFFSGRLMFPISDRQGRVTAFGGRYLPGQEQRRDGYEPPKYINSQESAIYKKRETLYALDLAIPEIRRTKTAYIAEGYMDVIALHQAGITNAVAPLGTAFTEEQAKLLGRWAGHIVLFFDTDGAGQNAAEKAIYTCRKNGLACSLVVSGGAGQPPALSGPDAAKDPADILKNSGPEALRKKAECLINDFGYLINRARALYGVSGPGGATVQGKAQAAAFLFPYMDLTDSEIARDSCIDAAADAFGVLPGVVREDYRRYAANRAARPAGPVPPEKGVPPGGAVPPVRLNGELSLLTAVAVDFVSPRKEKIYPEFRTALEIDEIEDPDAKELFIALEECSRYGESGADGLFARIQSPRLRDFLGEKIASGEFSANPAQFAADGLNRIVRRKRLDRRNDEIGVELRRLAKSGQGSGEGAGHSPEVNELLSEKMRIDNELQRLKGR